MELIVRRYQNLATGGLVEAQIGSPAERAMALDGQYEAVAEISIGHRDTDEPAETLNSDKQSEPQSPSTGYSGSITDEQLAELTKLAEVVLRKQKPETIAAAKADLLEAVQTVDPEGCVEVCEQFRILASVPQAE